MTELMTLGEAESRELEETLERIGSSNPEAKEIIDRARPGFNYSLFVEPVELDPAPDKMLEGMLKSAPVPPDTSGNPPAG